MSKIKQEAFMLRYKIQDVHIDYQQQYNRAPYFHTGTSSTYNIGYETVKMATVKLPVEMLEQIMYDLEMKDDEINIRVKNPAAYDAYNKYRMIVELLK